MRSDGDPWRRQEQQVSVAARRSELAVSGLLRTRECQLLAGFWFVALPDVFEGFGEGLHLDGAVYMESVFCKNELVVVFLRGEDARHAFVGFDPIVHVVTHDVGIEEVLVTDFHPDADGLARALRDEVLVELPCAVRSFGIVWPLLVDPGSGVGEDAVIELGVIPGHDESAGSAGASAGGGAAVGIVGELDVGLGFDEGKDFVFDKLGVAA
jgi:hypothetical protein